MISRLEEYKLLAQCALADNRQAFGRLVEAYRATVMSFLLNLTGGNVSLSDDLAQDTFIKAYVSVRSFNGLSRFKTWLYRIAYNEYISYCRKSRELLPDSLPDTADENETDERLTTINEAISELSEPIKAVIVLHYIEDQSIKEIAKVLDMPEGTVKVYLMRGRDKIKKTVKNER